MDLDQQSDYEKTIRNKNIIIGVLLFIIIILLFIVQLFFTSYTETVDTQTQETTVTNQP